MEFEIEEQYNGQKQIAHAAYRARAIDVVTGYDIGSNRWPVHVYVDLKKIEGISASADGRAEAFEYGLKVAREHIDGAAL